MGLDSLISRASERKSNDLGSIPSRDTDFLLRLTLTALRVSVTSSHSFNNNNNNKNNNNNLEKQIMRGGLMKEREEVPDTRKQ